MNDVSVRICDIKPGAFCTKNHHVSGVVRMAWELRNCGRGEAFDELIKARRATKVTRHKVTGYKVASYKD